MGGVGGRGRPRQLKRRTIAGQGKRPALFHIVCPWAVGLEHGLQSCLLANGLPLSLIHDSAKF